MCTSLTKITIDLFSQRWFRVLSIDLGVQPGFRTGSALIPQCNLEHINSELIHPTTLAHTRSDSSHNYTKPSFSLVACQ